MDDFQHNATGHSNSPEYKHDPDWVELFARNELIYFVEHSPQLFTDENLTTHALVEVLPYDDDAYTLSREVIETLEPLPAVRWSASNGRASTLFRLRSENVDVVAEYKRFQEYAYKNREGLRLTVPEGTQAVVRHVLPNWFCGTATHIGIGPHGPGGPPRAVMNPAKLMGLKFKFKDEHPMDKASEPGFKSLVSEEPPNENVVVYILDTIPARHRIQSALSNWPLLNRFEEILAPHGSAALSDPDVYRTARATYIYAAAMGQDFTGTNSSVPGHPYAVGKHTYDSSDHGLFVAGIVHALAPKARIYVIQVMNDNGVGTFMNFAAGFREIAAIHQSQHPGCHAIVNCSFTLSIPIGDHDQSPLGLDLATYESDHPGFKQQMDDIFVALSDTLAVGATVFAAAGNDSSRDNRQPPLEARYPAQFLSVTGVGALKRNLSDVAHYSNKADKPELEGIYVFGGDYDDHAPKAPSGHGGDDYQDSGDGIISIFTGNLNIDVSEPNHHSASFNQYVFYNPTGYAEWKGTSFATPVIVGTVAQLCMTWGLDPVAAFQTVDLYCDRSMGLRRFRKVEQVHA